MLTVKWINGRESLIHQAKEIYENSYGQVQWVSETGAFIDARCGTVWVMNDAGATVAKFDLGYGVGTAPTPNRVTEDTAAAKAA